MDVDLKRLQSASGSGPAWCFTRAGLRWCGGWRRSNLRGSHDQVQIEAKGRAPLTRPKDRHLDLLTQASRSIIKARADGYEARPRHPDAAKARRRHDRSDYGSN